MVAQPLHLGILGVLLALACISDVASRRVPNAVVAAMAVTGLVAHWAQGGARAAAAGAVAGLLAGLLLVGFWVAGKVGAGDVKLLGAAAIWIGPARLPSFLAATGLAAAALGLLVLATHPSERRRLRGRLAEAPPRPEVAAASRATVPVAVAVAAAVAAVVAGRGP